MIDIVTTSLGETLSLAEAIGLVLRGGETFELISDLGGGKTAFVKGLARGLGIQEPVQSPTFTISRLYPARDSLELHHLDFYRLGEAGVVAAGLAEVLLQTNAVIAVEWGQIVHDILPEARAIVRITTPDDTSRRLNFNLPESHLHVRTAIEQYWQQRNPS